MKLLSIGIYLPSGPAKHVTNASSFSSTNRAYMFSLAQKQTNLPLIQHNNIFYHLVVDQQYTYIIAADEKLPTDQLTRHFNDVKEILRNGDLREFDKKIADINYVASKLEKVAKEVEETKEALCAAAKKLLQRGERVEELVDKTQTLTDAADAFYIANGGFKTPAITRKKFSIWDKFRQCWPCSHTEDAEERETLLSDMRPRGKSK